VPDLNQDLVDRGEPGGARRGRRDVVTSGDLGEYAPDRERPDEREHE
jgi:hypothetical protein